MSKTSVINWRLTEPEKKGLDNEAKSLGIKRSRLLRRLVREFIRNRPDYFDDGLSELRAAHRELSAVGRNLNQIAARLNEERQARLAGDPRSKSSVEETALVKELVETQAKVGNLKRVLGAEIEAVTTRSMKVVELR